MNQEATWDVFISHASEDKNDVVEPLAEELKKRGLKVWYDKWVLKIGDRLLEKIDQGLSKSRYGIVILSPSFMRKEWTKNELDGLVQKEINRKKVILPVWHNISRNDLMSYSPILAGRLAGTTKSGIEALAGELIIAMDELAVQVNSPTVQKSIDVQVAFKKINITADLHKYSLLFKMLLNAPPARNGFLARLYLPSFIKVYSHKNFTSIKPIHKDNAQYTEYSFQFTAKIFPGDTVEVVSPTGLTELEYHFDHIIWSKVEHGKHFLFWEIYFDDQMPVKGSTDFRELNFF